MNICITPDLFKSFCEELFSMLEEREQLQGIDLSAIKNHIVTAQVEYCE